MFTPVNILLIVANQPNGSRVHTTIDFYQIKQRLGKRGKTDLDRRDTIFESGVRCLFYSVLFSCQKGTFKVEQRGCKHRARFKRDAIGLKKT